MSEVWGNAPLAMISKIKVLIGCDFFVNKTNKFERQSHSIYYYKELYSLKNKNINSNKNIIFVRTLRNKKYNGKEFMEMHGYNTYDCGARGMYPALMRFTTPDPLAEKYYSVSPYAYCGDNPIRYIDPTGMDWVENNQTKDITWNKNVTSANNTHLTVLFIEE